MCRMLGVLAAFAIIPSLCSAATLTEQVEAAAKNGKYTYVMFYRAKDTATQRMANTIQTHVTQTAEKTTWVTVDVRGPKRSHVGKNALMLPESRCLRFSVWPQTVP